jgi:hypothetical protein
MVAEIQNSATALRGPKVKKKLRGIDKVVDMAGGATPLAKYLKISTQAIYLWQAKGYVSAARALELEELYGVSRLELVKPELAKLLKPRR